MFMTQIIGKNRESHLGGLKRFRQEVCSSHAGLHRAERMLDGLTALAHSERVLIKALLHSIEQMLVLPSCKRQRIFDSKTMEMMMVTNKAKRTKTLKAATQRPPSKNYPLFIVRSD
jgi:hypothetical protein